MSSPWIDPPQPLRSARPRIHYSGAITVLITLVSLLAGLWLIAAGCGWVTVAQLGSRRWMLTVFGSCALLGGLLLAQRLAHTARIRARCASERTGWRRDHAWPQQARLNGEGRLARRYGCELQLPALPLPPGTCPLGILRTTAPQVMLTLRGLHETATWNRVGTHAPKIKIRQFYHQPIGRFTPIDGRLAFELPIPESAPATRLQHVPLTYWELLLQTASGLQAVILLPVYPVDGPKNQ